jgi:hypothetical protein
MNTSLMLKQVITREELFDFSRKCNEEFEKEEEQRRERIIDDKVKFYRSSILQAAREGKFIVYEEHTGLLMTRIVKKLGIMFPGVSFRMEGQILEANWSGNQNEFNVSR